MQRFVIRTISFLAALGVAASAAAQSSSALDRRWSVDFGLGWDNGISGNINSGAIGTLNNQTAVILKNTYDDVYGTGLHLRFGGGYLLDEESEVRVTFTFQSLDADLMPMGDLGISRLYGQYADYQSWGMDFGYRRYLELQPNIRAYGEGFLGVAFVDETDIVLAAPQINFQGNATDFYDRTAAFSFGVNAGVLFATGRNTEAFVQVGLRRMSGMSDVDNLGGTGLDGINNNSARWAMPLVAGIRLAF